MANFIVLLTMAYVAAGLIFAILFIAQGIEKIDAQTKGTGAGFRLIILPGVAAFWPLLLTRWMSRS
jgi:hypothetical protein